MPDHEDSLGGETFSGEEQQDPAEQSLGDGATMGGDTAAHSLGDQSTFGDANVDDELFDDGMELVDLSTRYTEEGKLGKGGFGEVILATDTRLNRKVAIKRIIGKAARSKKSVQRFLTEAQSIATLNHNNIVQIYDYGRATDGPFLIMECVQGGSLLDLCRNGPIKLDEAVKIFSQVCDGLAKAHAAGIIHRDIKPANILMTEDGIPKLTDFGLAKDDTADTGKTMEGAVIGTLDFMPPEQRQGAEFTDHRSDLWSLAATFYQMLTGKSPKVINISGIPPKLQSVVTTALEDSKEDRFQSVIEMREAILDAHSGKMDTSRSLGEGECPQCATLSPPDQKFCRNCSAQLQVNCLGCQAEIAIWDNGCGACGAQQAPLVDKGLADLKDAHDQAESLLVELDFKAAVKKAAVIENETDSRLQQFTTWHEDFSARLASSKSLEHTRLRELLQEALAHELAYDYKSGLQTLRPVVASLKQTIVSGSEDTADTLTTRLTAKRARIKELELLIRERVTKNELGGLLTLVNELLILKPERSDAQKLHAQLEKREAQIDVRNQHIIAQVRQHMRQLQFDEAVQVLGTIAPEYQTSTTVALIQKAAAEKAASADVCRAEAEFHNLDFINLDEVNIPYDILELVPEEIARENATLPLSLEGDALKVLLSDPRDLETIEKLRFILNREILIAIAPRENILEAINRYYGAARFSAKELRKTNPLTTPKNPLEHIVTIRSTMVGTFYDRPYPESEPYVRVGDMVTEESTVCIIKATQVFNKLTAEIHGKVVAVLVHDKAPVYIGKPLFKVDINA